MPVLKRMVCRAAAQANELIAKGLRRRQTSSHDQNAASSRSHMFVVFQQTTTTLADTHDGSADFAECGASFTLLDLAGEIATPSTHETMGLFACLTLSRVCMPCTEMHFWSGTGMVSLAQSRLEFVGRHI